MPPRSGYVRTNSPTIPVSECVGTLDVVTVSTATSGITVQVKQTTNNVVTHGTNSGTVNEVNLVVGAATELVAFVAVGAEEGFIEFVHSHSLTRTTDTIQESGEHFLNS